MTQMIRVNFLPWREMRRAERLKRFQIAAAIVVTLSVALVSLAHYKLSSDKANQIQRNAMLKKEATRLDIIIQKIKNIKQDKAQIVDRINVIASLQARRTNDTEILNAIAVATPSGVTIEKLTRQNKRITISGVAESNSRISVFMRNLDKLNKNSESRLSVIQKEEDKTKTQGELRRFTLIVNGIVSFIAPSDEAVL